MAELAYEQLNFVAELILPHGSIIKSICRFQARYGIQLDKKTIQRNYAKWYAQSTIGNFN